MTIGMESLVRLFYWFVDYFVISGHKLLEIQRIQYTSARLILQGHRWSSVTAMLKELHWLPQKTDLFQIVTYVIKGNSWSSPGLY